MAALPPSLKTLASHYNLAKNVNFGGRSPEAAYFLLEYVLRKGFEIDPSAESFLLPLLEDLEARKADLTARLRSPPAKSVDYYTSLETLANAMMAKGLSDVRSQNVGKPTPWTFRFAYIIFSGLAHVAEPVYTPDVAQLTGKANACRNSLAKLGVDLGVPDDEPAAGRSFGGAADAATSGPPGQGFGGGDGALPTNSGQSALSAPRASAAAPALTKAPVWAAPMSSFAPAASQSTVPAPSFASAAPFPAASIPLPPTALQAGGPAGGGETAYAGGASALYAPPPQPPYISPTDPGIVNALEFAKGALVAMRDTDAVSANGMLANAVASLSGTLSAPLPTLPPNAASLVQHRHSDKRFRDAMELTRFAMAALRESDTNRALHFIQRAQAQH